MALDWSILDLLNDDKMWEMVVNALLYKADEQCPYIWIKVKVNRPIWFISHMAQVASDRDRLFRNYRNSDKKNDHLYQ